MEINIEEIMSILPHRYPMLLVDHITELVPMKYAIGIKCVTINEPFFQGHFPEKPVMPGALICEAMAQVGGVALMYPQENRGLIPMFTGMDKVRFKQQVTPGDTLTFECSMTGNRGPFYFAKGKGFVNGKLAVSAELSFALI